MQVQIHKPDTKFKIASVDTSSCVRKFGHRWENSHLLCTVFLFIYFTFSVLQTM